MAEKKDPAADTAPPAPAAAPAAPPFMVHTAADVARQRELDALLRLQAKQEAARAASGPVDMIAQVGFTRYDDEHPDGVEVKPGQHFVISGFDVPGFLGKARLAEDIVEQPRGAAVS